MLVAFAVLALATPSFGAPTAPLPSPPENRMTGADLVKLITEAEAGAADFDDLNLVVTGEVDLRGLRTINRPLRCTNCVFEGPIRAANVAFAASIELTASTFEKQVEIGGATFEGRLTLDSATFDAGLSANAVRFFGPTSFDGVQLDGDAQFDDAVFADRAFLSRVEFDGSASFTGTSFTGAADFTSSTFHGDGDFQRASFNAGGSFVAAQFMRDANFDGAAVTGDLDFGFVTFEALTTFSSVRGPGTLRLERICLCPEGANEPGQSSLLMSNLAIAGLVMELDQVSAITGPGTQLPVLELIEATARQRGHAGTANSAHYELLTRRNEELSQPVRFLDAAFYGRAAGYFVRLRNPLWCLLLLLVLGGLIRAVPRFVIAWRAFRRPYFGATTSRRRGRLDAARAIAVSVVVGLCQGFSRAVSRSWSIRTRPAAVPDQPPYAPARIRPYVLSGLRWLEWLSVKLLIAVALIILANGNSTVRDLVDSVI